MYHYGIDFNNVIHCITVDLGVEMGMLIIITCTVIMKVVFDDVDEGVRIRVQEVSVSSK